HAPDPRCAWCGGGARVRGPSTALPLPRPAPRGAAAQSGAAPSTGPGRSATPRVARVLGDRHADADATHAGRGARLPGPQPCASRRVLRAPAVAADLQAAPHGVGLRPVLPDREVPAGRGP